MYEPPKTLNKCWRELHQDMREPRKAAKINIEPANLVAGMMQQAAANTAQLARVIGWMTMRDAVPNPTATVALRRSPSWNGACVTNIRTSVRLVRKSSVSFKVTDMCGVGVRYLNNAEEEAGTWYIEETCRRIPKSPTDRTKDYEVVRNGMRTLVASSDVGLRFELDILPGKENPASVISNLLRITLKSWKFMNTYDATIRQQFSHSYIETTQ